MRPLALLPLLALFLPSLARADQFVLVDADYQHVDKSHAYGTLAKGQPSNWKTPVNYAEGTAYYRLEVFEKPSAENLHMGVCFEGVSYCCFGYEQFTKPGVYEWSMKIPDMWQYSSVDFTKPITGVPLIMRDRNAVKVDKGEAFYDAPSTALYFPMKSHMTVTIVSKGGVYVKPPVDAGVDAANETGSDADADAAADTTSATDTALVDDVAPVADAPAAETAAPDAPSGSSGGCSTTGRAHGGAIAMLLLALSMRRTRR